MAKKEQSNLTAHITYTEGWRERFTELTVQYYIKTIARNTENENKGGK